jgi:hypothetical protein
MFDSFRNTYFFISLVALYSAETIPSDNVLLHYHHKYYDLILHLARFLSLRFLIERTFLTGEGFPGS